MKRVLELLMPQMIYMMVFCRNRLETQSAVDRLVADGVDVQVPCMVT